ncbi:MAG: carbohydrate ABC transporter permease [Ruminococcus sp.]
MKISFERRKSLYGYGFISLWFIGAAVFFLLPLVQSFLYSFQDVQPDTGGMTGSFAGLAKYSYALNEDPVYRSSLLSVLKTTIWKTPLIMIFSLFIAVVLNGRFRGRAFARAVFFLPVIIATGPVYNIISGNMASTGSGGSDSFSTMFRTDFMGEIMELMGMYSISAGVSEWIQTVSDNIFSIVWSSGIQIVIFLAALQHIPPSSKEAAQIEGASEWEYFWKITIPYVSPMILVCFIFSVIDSFTDPGNAVMGRIGELRSDWKFGESSAMAWIYFAAVMAAVGVISAVINKFVSYETE